MHYFSEFLFLVSLLVYFTWELMERMGDFLNLNTVLFFGIGVLSRHQKKDAFPFLVRIFSFRDSNIKHYTESQAVTYSV